MILNKYKLLKAKEEEKISENCMLFSLENLILAELTGKQASVNPEDIENYINLLKNQDGSFRNMLEPDNEEDVQISHDQLTSIACFSTKYNKDFHKQIWKTIKFFKYSGRTLHPRDWIYYAYLNNTVAGFLLFPIFLLITLYTFLTKYKIRNGMKIVKTDGELLSFVRYYSIKNPNILYKTSFKLFTWLLKKRFYGGWASVFRLYFSKTIKTTHPNHMLGDLL